MCLRWCRLMLVLIEGRDWSVSRAPGSAGYSPLPGTPFVHGCIRVVHGCICLCTTVSPSYVSIRVIVLYTLYIV